MDYIAKFRSSESAGSTGESIGAESPENCGPAGRARPQYFYTLYGVSLRSDIPLALKFQKPGDDAAIEIRTEPASFFARAIRGAKFEEGLPGWCQYAYLEDLSSYALWDGLGEFLVSKDGRQVHCRKFSEAPSESFQVYLLQRALSFALVKQGYEPLHATAVVVSGQALAFLGKSGFGKSSLAACFLAQGHELLTDDLLLLRRSATGLLAYPGAPRIKLFPAIAGRFLKDRAAGIPMNPGTKKLVLPLGPEQLCSKPVPLKAIYLLQSPREPRRTQGIRLVPLEPREAFLELLKNTYNYFDVTSDRLQRQFSEASRLANTVRLTKVRHSRVVGNLPALRDAILADVCNPQAEAVFGG
jgi:hypothetical protein